MNVFPELRRRPRRSPPSTKRHSSTERAARALCSAGLLASAALLGSAVLLHAPAVRAETPAAARAEASARSRGASSSSEARPSAGALIERGMELRRAGQDERALLVFEEAAALEPESARARVHLAATHQALGHWREADAYLREVLSEAEDPYVARHRTTLQKAAEFVGRHVGNLTVVGQPSGAEVRIDGRRYGTLPLANALRLTVGSHQLEVQHAGHHPLERPIEITAQGMTRESVELAPLRTAAPPASIGGVEDTPRWTSPDWLSWTLTGLAAGAAVTTGIALGLRERHASRWNSSSCLEPGRLRGEVCPGELDAGRDAERVAYASGVATLLLAAGAVVSWTLRAPGPAAPQVASCGLTWGGGVCAGSF